MNDTSFRQEVADVWHELSQISRAAIFGVENEKREPLHNREHAALPALGWVGSDYLPGGLLIMAANPGGGGDAYRPAYGDAELYGSFARLKVARSRPDMLAAFEAMSLLYQRLTTGHNISLPLQAILHHSKVTSDECAFLNVFPFRTREDKWPGAPARAAAMHKVVERQLSILRPSRLVCLGLKSHAEAIRYLRHYDLAMYGIPRTIGDRRIHPDAVRELQRLQLEGA
jgi:hypothetical protein